jgi:Domain of unknown function (DUF1905)/Bacteriocin-protection, YdeI or OmpD-Associated
MVTFKAIIQKFGEKGEKSGWTYLLIPAHIAQEINPKVKTSYRVKGLLDAFAINHVSLVPMGDGDFIIAFNDKFRKGLGKNEGATVAINIELDTSEMPFSEDLLACIADEPKALEAFEKLTNGHKRYFSNWVDSAKTIATKSKRIAMCVEGLALGMDYGEMIRFNKGR